MTAKKIIAGEGNLVAVPVSGYGYVIGLIAYTNKRIMLGFFFNKTYLDIPSKVEPYELNKKKLLLVARFSSLRIESGEWPLIKSPIDFKKIDWPIPVFKMKDPLTGKYFSLEYKEDLLEESRRLITENEAIKLYDDGLYGSVALQNKFYRLLKSDF
jgi:hypothetical protein